MKITKNILEYRLAQEYGEAKISDRMRQEIYQKLLEEENELLLATMDPSRSEEVFAFGKKWFPYEYSIVDLDMHLIYRSDNLHTVLGGEKVDRIPSESLSELILSKEFHDAAKIKDNFTRQ